MYRSYPLAKFEGQMLRARRAWRRQDLAEKLQMRWELQQRRLEELKHL